jgi:hypothetical protein
MAPLSGPRPDAGQVLQDIYDPVNNAIQVEIPLSAPIPVETPPGQPLEVTNVPGQSIAVDVLNALIPQVYDSIALTYWTSGNGTGQVETVQYYTGGLSGTLVATLTLNYNGNTQVSSVVRT